MIDYLTLALERGGQIERAEEDRPLDVPGPDGPLFRAGSLPDPLKCMGEGEGRSSLSPGPALSADEGESREAPSSETPSQAGFSVGETGLADGLMTLLTDKELEASIGGRRPLKRALQARETERAAGGETAVTPLLSAVRRAQAGADFVRENRRSFALTLPETAGGSPGWTMEDLDRAVERDTRRYDGNSPLY